MKKLISHKTPRPWGKYRLGDLFKIKHGYPFKSEYFSNEGKYIVLTPGNFQADGGLKLKGEKEKYYTADFPLAYLLKKNDFLVVMTDLTQNAPILGSPAFIKTDDKFLHNQRLGKVIDLDESMLKPKFLYYLFNSTSVRAQITGSATGATVKHTAPERIYAVDVKIPPAEIQDKIASILSAYDDLIENNNRRIKILEEMAQAIYKEWFVNFRFPGHEKVKMVKSEIRVIPEGWEIRKLKDVAEVNKQYVNKSNSPDNILYIDISSVTTGSVDNIMLYKFSEAPGRARRIVKHGDVIWSSVRPNRKSYALIINPEPNLIVSTGFGVISAKKVPYIYIYMVLTTDEFIGYLTNNARGAAYPAVNTEDYEKADVLVPPVAILTKFQEIIEPCFRTRDTLQKKIKVLRKTRDLLLPKLISGEIDVENLGINIEGIT